ncbi:NCS2 family permease [Levyella massiliensis]|uniref:NCS2 family permease n=1 Tax=Levyella massiliensis TaxID=938289 RepID=UPI0024ACFE51|nr:NCS2 family permease [Levyella massiliensis]
MSNLSSALEKRFKLKENNTDLRTELLAGVTTFATMSYVLATIPNMLEKAGLVRGSILTMLILAIVACSVAMALYTNRPFCLAPGMSSVAILSSIDSIGMSVEVAFGLIFIEGVIFVIISFAGLRNIIATAIPASIKIALSGGIGLYIALIGLKSGGIIVASQKNTLIFGDLSTAKALMFGIGFLLVLIFEARKIKGSMILSVILVTIIGIPLGVTKLPTTFFHLPSGIGNLAFKMDILGALKPEYLPWLLTFFVPDFFGTMGIILGVANQAGWLDENGDMPGIEKCFKVDSLSTVAGSFFCMPVMTTYLESASGVEDGGRTGLTAIMTSVLFALMLFFTPFALMVPGVATGPVLTIIGFQMLSSMRSVDYSDKTECLPAFIAVAMTILTYNIANGMALSIVSYLILKIAAGRIKEIPKPMFVVGICMLFYLYTLI